MKSKHTQGPWKIVGKVDGLNGIGIMAANDGYTYVADVCKRNHQEMNARLIAAAPELLEQLKLAEVILRSFNAHPDFCRTIKDAITKAEGDSK